MPTRIGWGFASLLAVAGCGGPEAIPGTQLAFDLGGGFWDAPFPSAHRRGPNGEVSLAGFPNPGRVELVLDLRRVIEADADGFGTTSTLYFRASSALDPGSLPDRSRSTRPGSSVFLVDVDPASPDRGRRYPLEVRALPDPGPFGAPHLLALLPLQGAPLAEGTLHAAVVTRDVRDAEGARLGVPVGTRRLLDGEPIDGMTPDAADAYRTAVEALDDLGVDLDAVAALSAFRTGNPSRGLSTFLDAARAEGVEIGPFASGETLEDFCVFEARATFPVYQAGTPPYARSGGGWVRGPDGVPRTVRRAESRLVLTLPRRPVPPSGFPTTVFVRTGGGGDRPLVDRGRHATPGGPPVAPGTGPARELARAGFAGLSWDGPLGGLRNPTGGDEQFLIFNFANPAALRDNIRQSALEAALLAEAVGELVVTATACPGLASEVRLDPGRLALMGHSMGGTIAPLAAAVEPRFGALVLSGAGGSWIANVIHKESPVRVRPLAEVLLDYDDEGRTLEAHDPALALLQWAGEPADPPVYARRWRARAEAPPRVLMLQGIVDTYILPPIANALSLAAGLDLVGPSLEPSIGELLAISGGRRLDPPAVARGAVTHHPEDGIEDGHEVVFQSEGPKRQYRCFLEAFRRDEEPVVVSAEPEDGPCP